MPWQGLGFLSNLFGMGMNMMQSSMAYDNSMMANMMNLRFQREANQFNWFNQHLVNQQNAQLARELNTQNVTAQTGMNEANIGMQRETNLQNLQLQHEAWNREDNAVQRRVADLRAAGMNPVLAAGQGAQASGPISLNAPRGEAPQATHRAQMQAARMEALRIETDIAERALRMRDDFATSMTQRMLMMANAKEHDARADQIERETGMLGDQDDSYGIRLRQMEQQIATEGVRAALGEAQAEAERLRQELVSAQTYNTILHNVRQEVENEVAQRTMETRITQEEVELLATQITNQIAEREEAVRESFGVTRDGSLIEKGVQAVRNLAGRGLRALTDLADRILESGGLGRDGWRTYRK